MEVANEGYSSLYLSSSTLDQNENSDPPFTQEVIFSHDGRTMRFTALIDTGAQGSLFIDETAAQQISDGLDLPTVPLLRPKFIRGYNSPRVKIKEAIFPTMTLQGHTQSLAPLLVTPMNQHEVIIGKTWLRRHGVSLDLVDGSLSFRQGYCDCQPSRNSPGNLKAVGNNKSPPEPVKPAPTTPPFMPTKILKRPSNHQPPSVENSEEPEESEKPKKTKKKDELEVAQIGAAPFMTLARNKECEVFAITMRDINQHLEKQKKPLTDPREILPPEYHDLLDVFSKKASDELPPHRSYDHRIELEGDPQEHLKNAPLYHMSNEELAVVKKYLEENLGKGFIRASCASIASPVLFVRKPGGGLRFCVDYRKLNAITKKDRYPLPLIEETLNQLMKAKFFTKIDIRQAFHRIRMREGDEDLTTFKTRFGLYKYLVLPFGLTNGPASFQRFINDALWEHLGEYVTAYLDDILIYSDNLKEHRKHVRSVLVALRKAGLQADIDKCEFHTQEVKFLGLIVGVNGVRMDPEKIAAILKWEEPETVTQVQVFIGLCNFYRRFVKGFSRIAKPLHALTKKDVPFKWSDDCKRAFRKLQDRITNAPVLKHFDPKATTYVEADSSDFVNGGVLSQIDEHGEMRPVAFFSKTMNPAECNYDIYDKELLAIIRCLEEWRPELESCEHPIKILTDHKSLEYFYTTKKLSRRQARWAQILSRYNFVIQYRPGKQNAKADALTRRPQDMPASDEDDRQRHQMQTLLPPERLDPQITKELELNPVSELNLFDQAIRLNQTNPEIQELRTQAIEQKDPAYTMKNGVLYYRDLIFVPEAEDLRERIVQTIHEQPTVGHPGIQRTLSTIRRSYYWPEMKKMVERCVNNCNTCRRAKAPRDQYNGKLQPLPVPDQPWEDIAMDFVTGLPESNGCDAIFVVIDRLTKMRHYIACKAGEQGTSAEQTAQMFLKHVWKHHGLPRSIVSDRGPQFVSGFWQALCQILQIKAKLSTAFHPETDGQTEAANKEMERYLRSYVNYQQDDWEPWLSMAEYAENAQISSSIGMTPFFANYGYEPRTEFDLRNLKNPSSTRERLEQGHAIAITQRMRQAWDNAKKAMREAQHKAALFADRHRKEVSYQVGDKVFLSTKNIDTTRPAKKLDWKMIGPFEIIRETNGSYELDLPESMKHKHPVFHPSLLRKAADDPLPGQVSQPDPPIEIQGEPEFGIDDILDSRKHYRRLQYKAKWTGYPAGAPENDVWYDASNFDNAKEVVEDFHSRYPHKPR